MHNGRLGRPISSVIGWGCPREVRAGSRGPSGGPAPSLSSTTTTSSRRWQLSGSTDGEGGARGGRWGGGERLGGAARDSCRVHARGGYCAKQPPPQQQQQRPEVAVRAGPMAARTGFGSVLMDPGPTATLVVHARGWDARVRARTACDKWYRNIV